jgi:hypothetical protein
VPSRLRKCESRDSGIPLFSDTGSSSYYADWQSASTKKAALLPLLSTFSVFLHMVETQREDLDDYLKQDFRPIFLFAFSFHIQW